MTITLAAIEHILNMLSFSFILIVILINIFSAISSIFGFGETLELRNSSEIGLFFCFFCTTALLIFLWIESGFFPLTNLRESLAFLSCVSSLIYFILKTRNNQNELNKITITSTILTQAFFAVWGLFFSPEIPKLKILVPALQSLWLLMHVSIIMVGYVVLIIGCLLSIAVLILMATNDAVSKEIESRILDSAKGGLTMAETLDLVEYYRKYFPNYFKIDFIEDLDSWSYRTISIGFALLTLGILCGAVWANEAWGAFWSWDPKETWALITWITFGIYLHVRMNQNWKGKNVAFIAFIGFLFIWVCYFGINLLGIGLHSYGSFN
ncbi:hypothetical protein LUZ62_085013 [Rhynchospora pubera]|uniref:Cytochrome c assembly protein domain-containing protein n=1 Tax=Rhynchospora pubera TaxID=906938 RepID=A0AAV8C9H8_9POAL|nr:hypothetical protein LUZ62_085013 [Rhynchospora pubera]